MKINLLNIAKKVNLLCQSCTQSVEFVVCVCAGGVHQVWRGHSEQPPAAAVALQDLQ